MVDGHSGEPGADATQSALSLVSQVESRVIFEQELGQTASAVKHEKTSVLLLGWTPKLDDTKVGEEVCLPLWILISLLKLTCSSYLSSRRC